MSDPITPQQPFKITVEQISHDEIISRMHEKCVAILIENTPDFTGKDSLRQMDWEWAIQHVERLINPVYEVSE